ncbi:MAG: hypothetical protein LBR93_08455 [Treponema sp.]|nr:hypothetical protein [Treponema sp.]
MPKTTVQRLTFTGIGVFFMVIVMALFNKSIVAGAFTWYKTGLSRFLSRYSCLGH